MAKANYSFEKRQRELAKKRKKAEKKLRKAETTTEDSPQDAAEEVTPAEQDQAPDTDTNPSPE